MYIFYEFLNAKKIEFIFLGIYKKLPILTMQARQMSKKVQFSNDSKDYDGSSYITEECYKIVSAFFTKSTIYHQKIGKTQEEIDEALRNNVTFSPTYCVKQFVKATKTGKCEILLPIQSADDCVNAVGGDISVIYACIGHLNRALENIKEKRIEKFKRILEKPVQRKLETDDEWDKTCTADVCYNRNCCYDKKMKMKLKENVSVIRSGGRDCNCVAPLEFQVWLEKLLGILKEALEKDRSDYDDDNLYEEIMV